jgi:hypothetical protein
MNAVRGRRWRMLLVHSFSVYCKQCIPKLLLLLAVHSHLAVYLCQLVLASRMTYSTLLVSVMNGLL